MIRRLLPPLLLLFCVPLFAWQHFGDIEIVPESPIVSKGNRGYTSSRLRIINHSKSQRRHVHLSVPSELIYVDFNVDDNTIAAIVEPESSVTLTMPFWRRSYTGITMEVTVDGQTSDNRLAITGSLATNRSSGIWRLNMLTTRDLGGLTTSPGVDDFDYAKVRGRLNSEATIIKAETSVSDWGADWITYTQFDALAMSAQELAVAPESVVSAVTAFVEAGGVLCIAGDWPGMPDAWRVEPSVKTAYPGRSRLGFGDIFHCPADTNQWDQALWVDIKAACEKSQDPFKDVSGKFSLIEKTFPVVEQGVLELRGYLLIFICFVLLVGPLNMYLLNKLGKRIWLLWTVPAAAIFASLLVVGFAFFGEGFHSRLRLKGITLLDETRRQAATIGVQGIYAPLGVDDLLYSMNTELTPILSRSLQNVRNVDWTSGQRLGPGWVSARIPSYFGVRSVETRRERLVVNRLDSGQVSVTNGLGATIKHLYLADEAGLLHEGRDIAPGAKVNLSADGRIVRTGAARSLRSVYGDLMGTAFLYEIKTYPVDFLKPNTYLAVLEGAPFFDNPLSNQNAAVEADTMVYGIQGGAGEN